MKIRCCRRASAPGAYTQNDIVHNGKLDDGVFLLGRPYRRDELARKIRGILDSRPKSTVAPPAPSPEPNAGTAPSASARKVLVVEDEALIRMTTVDMVGDLGLECREAAAEHGFPAQAFP